MKSPLKDKPLRNPGQSLEAKIYEAILDEASLIIFAPVFLLLMAGFEWFRWYMETPPAPWLYTITAMVSIVYALYRYRKAMKKLAALKQGRDGEKAVGQYLDLLRANGAQVFHDILGEGFNLDHVVIDRSGVYVIETKTYSKPDKGSAKIIFKGDSIVKNGYETNKPIVQAKAAANWLAEVIQSSTGKKLKVKPVVVFPGWYVEATYEARSSDVWVLNPKALPSFIEHSQDQLMPEEVKMVSLHLSRYVRSSNAT